MPNLTQDERVSKGSTAFQNNLLGVGKEGSNTYYRWGDDFTKPFALVSERIGTNRYYLPVRWPRLGRRPRRLLGRRGQHVQIRPLRQISGVDRDGRQPVALRRRLLRQRDRHVQDGNEVLRPFDPTLHTGGSAARAAGGPAFDASIQLHGVQPSQLSRSFGKVCQLGRSRSSLLLGSEVLEFIGVAAISIWLAPVSYGLTLITAALALVAAGIAAYKSYLYFREAFAKC